MPKTRALSAGLTDRQLPRRSSKYSWQPASLDRGAWDRECAHRAQERAAQVRHDMPADDDFAKTLRRHRPRLLNWFHARRSTIAIGAAEGFNNKARITMKKAYGFRTYEHMEIALYHALGNLPVPPWLTRVFPVASVLRPCSYADPDLLFLPHGRHHVVK